MVYIEYGILTAIFQFSRTINVSNVHYRLTSVLISITDKFPPSLTVPLSLKSSLRYGENPHQKAAFYVNKRLAEVNAGGIATAIQHHGKV
jgi:AICAR transformylase/IMP cyclohydrolase PurH